MTDLTKKYQNCELPEGWYYIKDENGQIIIAEYSAYCIDKETNETECDWSCSSEPEQVIAEVPDYIEWRNMVNCACEEHEANKCLIEENAELKELLNEWVHFEIEENPNDFTVMSERMSELANKTKEVLR